MEAQIAAAAWHLPHIPRSEGGVPAIAFLAQTYASLDDMARWAKAVIASRDPDFIIGPGQNGAPDYIRRWFIVPRNGFANVYLHLTQRDDDDRALHDHPWPSRSVIIEGGYVEVTPEGSFERLPGDVIERDAEAAHRLALRRDDDGAAIPCISLFFTGPKVREWGFHCPKGWVPWREFVDDGDTGKVGRGCGE